MGLYPFNLRCTSEYDGYISESDTGFIWGLRIVRCCDIPITVPANRIFLLSHMVRFCTRHLEILLVTIVIIALTIANSWHIVSRFLSAPPNSVFIGISHYHEDYFYYLSQVTQGARGAWMVSNLYTAEAIPPQFLWWPNILLGKIAAISSLPSWTVFDLAVITTAALSLISVYWVSSLVHPHDRAKRLATFLLAATTSTFYFLTRTPEGKFSVIPHQFFYNYTGSLNRLGGVFHLILQNVLSVVIIVCASVILDHCFRKKHSSGTFSFTVIITSVTSFFLAFINPVYIFVDGCAVAITAFILLIIIRPKISGLVKLAAAAIIIALPLTLPYAGMQQALKEPYFQYFRWWETNVKRVTPEEFFLSMGPLTVLAALGIIPFLRKGGVLRLLGVVWTVFPLTLYFTWIPIKLQIPFFRLPQPPQYIFLAALAVETLALPSLLLIHFRKKLLAAILFAVIIAGWVLAQIPPLKTEIDARNNSHVLGSWLNYMNPDIIAAMRYLEAAPDNRIVLAINNVELLVPALAGRTVYVGHHSITLDYPEKIAAAARFFNRSMTPEEGLLFLRTNNIGYVLWRNEDGGVEKFPAAYPFLTVLFQNPAITIFTYTP